MHVICPPFPRISARNCPLRMGRERSTLQPCGAPHTRRSARSQNPRAAQEQSGRRCWGALWCPPMGHAARKPASKGQTDRGHRESHILTGDAPATPGNLSSRRAKAGKRAKDHVSTQRRSISHSRIPISFPPPSNLDSSIYILRLGTRKLRVRG